MFNSYRLLCQSRSGKRDRRSALFSSHIQFGLISACGKKLDLNFDSKDGQC